MTYEEKLIVERLQSTYADVDEMQKVFDIVVNTLALREAEIEELNAEWHAEIERSKRYAAAYEKVIAVRDAEIERLKVEIFDQQEQRFWMQQRLSSLLNRAVDALEATLPMKQYAFGSQLPYYDLIAELRKAAAE